MNRNKKNEFKGTEGELLAMTRELDDMHNDLGMPAMWQSASEMIDAMREDESRARQSSRRSFLFGASAAAVGGAALLTLGTPALAGAIGRAGTKGTAL